MSIRFRTCFLIFGLLFAVLLSGCQGDPNTQAIQGSWVWEDPHLQQVDGQPHWVERWIFDRGSFANTGCCFGEVNIIGSYRILESGENELMIELYNMEGTQGTMPVGRDVITSIEVKIDPEADTLFIGRKGPFDRVSP